jgi:hypothetical protein
VDLRFLRVFRGVVDGASSGHPSSIAFLARLRHMQASQASRRGPCRQGSDPVAMRRRLGYTRRYTRRSLDRDCPQSRACLPAPLDTSP